MVVDQVCVVTSGGTNCVNQDILFLGTGMQLCSSVAMLTVHVCIERGLAPSKVVDLQLSHVLKHI